MNPALRERVARVTGAQPVAWTPRFRGYAANERWSVTLEDGGRVFVKHGAAELLAEFLREEYRIYAELRAPFMPQLVGFDDDGDWPLLVLEDLESGDWPPPWTAERIDTVRATLDELHVLNTSARLPRPSERIVNLLRGWDIVADDPAPFLSLGLVDAGWLERSLPALLKASHAAPVDGEQLIHFDVRSDNVCFARGRAILVDWNLASRGSGDFDLAFWLPSLAAEGGPQPWELLPGAPELAALCAGFFAGRAGLPPPETAPAVRAVQLAQLVPALAWARRELAL